MNPRMPLDPRLLESLSAYLDGKLTGAECTALEERLAREETLRDQLADLRAVRDSLRSLPMWKPPRALTLSRAQAGVPARKPEGSSSRWMAFGSALAALAFVAVVSSQVLSGRSVVMEAMPVQAPQLFLAPGQAREADDSGAGSESMPTTASVAEASIPAPTYEATHAKSAGGGAAESTATPVPTGEPAPEGCEFPTGANAVMQQCGVTETPAPFSFPDFQTLAPFLEIGFGGAAVVLAVLAIFRRRRI